MNDKPAFSDWRNVIDWGPRLRREGPFLDQVFSPGVASGLPKKILDVGCGSGEHCQWFGEQGWTAVGIDIKEEMIESAKDLEGPTESGGKVLFELLEGAQAHTLKEAPLGGALYIGNGTAFMHEEEDLRKVFTGVAGALAPGAPFLIQTLNYTRIETLPLRALPVNVRPLPEDPDGDAELVFIRVLRPRPKEGFVTFFPIGLELYPDPDFDEPPKVTVRQAKQLNHRAWKQEDFTRTLEASGFGDIQWYGGMQGEPFDIEQSHDLVIVAKRQAS